MKLKNSIGANLALIGLQTVQNLSVPQEAISYDIPASESLDRATFSPRAA